MAHQRNHILFLVLIFTACLSTTGCGKQNVDLRLADEEKCWAHATSEKLVPLGQMRETLSEAQQTVLKNCKRPPNVRFFLKDARVAYAVMRHGISGEPLSIHFHGKNLPRERWDEGEDWCTRFCKHTEVTCITRVTADGKVLFDPVWNDRHAPY